MVLILFLNPKYFFLGGVGGVEMGVVLRKVKEYFGTRKGLGKATVLENSPRLVKNKYISSLLVVGWKYLSVCSGSVCMHVCIMEWIIRFAQHELQQFQLCNLSKLGRCADLITM